MCDLPWGSLGDEDKREGPNEPTLGIVYSVTWAGPRRTQIAEQLRQIYAYAKPTPRIDNRLFIKGIRFRPWAPFFSISQFVLIII